MSSLRKFRFPIFIGAGVIAAGVLVYMTNSRINLRQTQGAIGKRDVYRDSQVNTGDVKASPGSAPVASKVLLESKEFKSLAKNQAFQNLLSSPAFASIAQSSQFLLVLQNANFLQMLQHPAFAQLLSNGAVARMASQIRSEMAAQAQSGISQSLGDGSVHFSQQTLSALNANSAQQLATNQAFHNLMYNANFLSFISNQANSQAMASLTSNAFAGLLASSQFQSLLNQSAFVSALQTGSAASLKADLQQALVMQ